MTSAPFWSASHLGIDFGGLTAVDDFNMAIGRTEIAGLIGPNGAGKTTVFNLLTKVYQPTRGTILLDGMDTAGMTTAQVNQRGHRPYLPEHPPVRQPDGGGQCQDRPAQPLSSTVCADGVFRTAPLLEGGEAAHERALELLSIFDMQDLADAKAGSLPYGAQRRLEIVRALATEPSAAAAGRAGRGHEPLGDRRADGEHPSRSGTPSRSPSCSLSTT